MRSIASLSAAVMFALLSSATRAFAFDVAAESVDGTYSRMRLTGLHVSCGSNGDCASVFGHPQSPYAPVPGTGDRVTSIVPRENVRGFPASGIVDHFDLPMSDAAEVRFDVGRIGIPYPIGFTVQASAGVGDRLHFQGYTPQRGQCVMVGMGELVGVKVLHFDGAGANACTSVNQLASPFDDGDGLRHYKGFSETTDPSCAPSQAALAATSRANGGLQNFFVVDYHLNNPDPMTDHYRQYLAALARDGAAVSMENARRAAMCAPLSPEARALRADCAMLQPVANTSLLLTADECAVYDGRGDARQFLGRFEAFTGTLGRLPASASASFPAAQTTVDLDRTHICRYIERDVDTGRDVVRGVRMDGQVLVYQPRGEAHDLDEEYEMGQLSRGIDFSMAMRVAGVPVYGGSFTPYRGNVMLRAGTSVRVPFTFDLGVIDYRPAFTGTLEIDARGPLVGLARPALLPVVGTWVSNMCLELDPFLGGLWDNPAFTLPYGMDDPAPDVFSKLASTLTAQLELEMGKVLMKVPPSK